MRTVGLVFLLLFCGSLLAKTNPVPFVNDPLVPDAVKPGSKGFTLTVNGTGFATGAVVQWNGTALSTTFVSTSKLKATVPASDLVKPMTAAITVVNPAPGGGASNISNFEVRVESSKVVFSTRAFNIGKHAVYSQCVGDFNNDGKLDVAGWNHAYNTILIALGNGNGRFRNPIPTPFQPRVARYATGMVPGDFNGDGKLDLAFLNSENTMAIFLGKGNGKFQSQKDYYTGLEPGAIAIADFNADGKLDLAVSDGYDNTVGVFLGNGDGTFQDKIDSDTGGVGPQFLAVGDFNHDGILDLAVSEPGSAEITIMLGKGDGTFSFYRDVYATVTVGMFATDFDGDGNLDLAIANTNDLQILYGKGNGDFHSPVTIATGKRYEWLNINDMIGNGKPGLVADDEDDSLVIIPNLGGRKFGNPITITLSEPSSDPVLGDFNNDGRTDVNFEVDAATDTFNDVYLQRANVR